MIINDKANELIQGLMKKHPHTLLTIGILHKGETSFKLFNKEGEIPYESHLYEMGSIGKTFTISLLAKYVSEGKMKLDDSVAKYIPELNDGKYYPTLKRLATHTAGYPTRYPIDTWGEIFSMNWKHFTGKQYSFLDYAWMDKERILKIAKYTKLKDKDYKWRYANFGIAFLGLAIANVAQKSPCELLTDYYQGELGLKNTVTTVGEKKILTGFDKKNRVKDNWQVDEHEYMSFAGGGPVTTAEDMLEWARLNIEETPSYLALAHETRATGSILGHMGLGWWLNLKGGTLWHGGNTDGFATYLTFAKEKEFALVILANVAEYKEYFPLGNAIINENWES